MGHNRGVADKRGVFFILAAICFVCVLGVELGARWFAVSDLSASPPAPAMEDPPVASGYGIGALVFLDALFAVQVAIFGLAFVSDGLIARVDGIAKLIAGLLALIGGIVFVLLALFELLLMLGLLMAVPFGTAIYFAVYSDFPRGSAIGALAALLVLRILGGLFLVLWSFQVLKARALIVYWAMTLVCTLIVSFLLSVVPGFLCSITDAIAGIIVGIVAAIAGLVWLIRGIIGVVKAVRGELR